LAAAPRAVRLRGVARVDLVDETFVAAHLNDVAAVVADQRRWSEWFPGLTLTVFMDRGLKGIRWSVAGDFVGSTEIWLEPFADGVILHYYLRVEPTAKGSRTVPNPYPDTPSGFRAAAKQRVKAATRGKRIFWALKDELEGDREVGTSAVSAQKGDHP
jgi:hypothetical protein